jgi:hypothetical protein
MANMDNVQALLAEIAGKLGEHDAAIKGMQEQPKRKMVFDAEAPLRGSKFASYNAGKDDLVFLNNILVDAHKRGLSRGPSESLTNAVKAMDTAEAGYGLELMGAQYDRSIWDIARSQSKIFGLIPQVPLTDATAYFPVAADIPEMLLVGESTSSTATNYTTSPTGFNRVQVTPKKFVVHQMWSGELEEDSIVPFVAELRNSLATSIGYYMDSLVVNGDTTNAATGNINLDDADPADTKHYLAFDGMRQAALVANTANSTSLAGAPTLAAVLAAKGLMIDRSYLHEWGNPLDPSDLVITCDYDTYFKLLSLDQVVTVDKFGPNATVLTGQLASLAGHPVIPSVVLSKTKANGKVSATAGNNTKGQILLFNRRAFKIGMRREVRIETERLPATDQNRLVATARVGFGRYTPTGAASGIEGAALIYNVTV